MNRKAEQLKFLDGKEVIHVQDKACIQANYPIGNGDGIVQIYDLFPGIQLMINDFQTDSCFQSGMEQNAITIDHCRKGRFECVFDRQHYLYLGEGDFSIHNVLRSPVRSSFPLHYFYGSTIILFPESCENAPELQLFGIDTERLTEKYQLDTQCHVFRRNEDIDHEATASIDAESETLVQEALSRLLQNKTVLVIAHRMRTVSNADKIVVLDAGKIAEMGTPTELLEKKGIFYRLIKEQM